MENIIHRPVLKRNKPSLTCSNCRWRKVKCNRNQPCATCIKFGNEDTCVYNLRGPKMISQNNINSQELGSCDTLNYINTLKEKIVQLEKSLEANRTGKKETCEKSNIKTNNDVRQFEIPLTKDDDSVNVYDGYCSMYVKEPYRRVNFGPLTWLCFMNKDPWLHTIWKYTNDHDDACVCIYSRKMPRINKEDSSVFRSSENDELKGGKISEKIFRRRLLEQAGYDESAPFKTYNNIQPEEFIKQSQHIKSSSIVFARALFEGKFNAELHLLEKIKIVIPNKKAAWSLIDLFFEKLYAFMPFIDQREFLKTLTRIFGPVCYLNEPIEEIKIKRKLDLAVVAQFLIIIRLTYLSLFSNRDCVNEYTMNNATSSEALYDYNFLLSTPVNLTTIDVAQNCIDNFQFSRKSNLTVLQALILMRIYHKLAPEYGDGLDGGDSMVSSAVIGQVAISIGLNREPNKFKDTCNDERINNLGRKLWAAIVQESYINSIMSGHYCKINTRNADVSEPFYTNKNSNVLNSDLERSVLEEFTWLPRKIPLDDFLENVTNIEKYTLTNELTADLNKIEKICLLELHTLDHVSRISNYAFLEVKRAQLFLTIRSSILSAYSHLFFHFEKQKDRAMAFFFVKKHFLIVYEEFIPYYFEVILGKYNAYGLILNPSIILCLHKSNQVNLYFLARLKYQTLSMESECNHLENLNNNLQYRRRFSSIVKLSNSLKIVVEQIIMSISRFSSRYYHSWRVSRAQILLSKFLLEDEVYKSMLKKNTLPKCIIFDFEQLTELEELTSHIISRLTKIDNYKDSHNIVPIFDNIQKSPSQENTDVTQSCNDVLSNNDAVDNIWLLMLLNQNYPNIFGIDYEFELSQANIDHQNLKDFDFDSYS